MRLPFSLLLFSLLLFASCATSRHAERRFSKKIQKEVAKSPVFNRAFTGFTLLDPETGRTLADVNGDKYFTPASNTKILTLATCLEVLGDSVPGIQFIQTKDTFYFRGTGDPTFLHPNFVEWQSVFLMLKTAMQSEMVFSWKNWKDGRFGPGWAWDDYMEEYSAERSPMPTYGNVAVVRRNGTGWVSTPRWVQPKPSPLLRFKLAPVHRDERIEAYNYFPNDTFPVGYEQKIPLHFSESNRTLTTILMDTLNWRMISEWPGIFVEGLFKGLNIPDTGWHTLYSTPLDTVLRRMMYQSDNFIAEQMLLVCAGQKFDILQQDTMIKWMLDSVLTSLPQRPRWVDGSGLSRYNLISPRDLSQVLFKLWKEQPHDYLLSLFPAGGVNGTVADFYKGKNGKPYVFAKTGGMSGVHCLSGYIVTKRGKTLIFSFMHNNFVGSNRAWKEEMQRILEMIWEGN
jgi:D-alanyl-D-alanine carboxypeptidase/D-alanyl-D-alanine-endopeptidase (penicillin-binding protein 4)